MKGRVIVSDVELRSLAPKYEDEHHRSYVSRLSAAVLDPRNKNIALTGRYGVGKSSILDKFVEIQECPETTSSASQTKGRKKTRPKKVLRISINTLGPDEGEELTNRIQKELVKQLVYRAQPGELSTSRFARPSKLTKKRAALDALVAAVALIGLLWLFGVRPDKDSMGTDGFLWPMLAFLTLVFAVLWAIRWHTGSRIVAQVSAGGASISLEGKDDSFFDKYLDELITFFEATEPDIVIFEDLDRFDDPRIFDSLRELNTLVNTSAHWINRTDKPLRFIYAIKDSLFEKLGNEQQNKDAAGKPKTDADIDSILTEPTTAANDKSINVAEPKKKDVASEAVKRANRTKFFEIVIPVVPFLSHINARDHFLKELERLALPEGIKIDRGLIDIVARHTTDMRLMINIGNEFVVYAERLLWIEKSKRAPGLSSDRLFALVVYKNFHLADFEALPHRGSALDTLDKGRRDLVQTAIEVLQSERSDLVSGTTQRQKQRDLATALGRRLKVFLDSSSSTLEAAKVGDVSLDTEKTSDRAFWQTIGQAGSIDMTFRHRSGHSDKKRLGTEELKALFPEAADPDAWLDTSSTSPDLGRITAIDAEIAMLRGASFKSLAENDRYTDNGKTFKEIIEDTLPSKLACELISGNYIDRFYAEYATVFYGDFLGVDVANFFRNSVWPNEMDMQFTFTTGGAVANVLDQAPKDFLRTRSALNIEIINHLMNLPTASATDLIDFLARPSNEDGKKFLRTYFNTPKSRGEKLASLLAAKLWSEFFSFIAEEGLVDADETKVVLLSAGLLSAREFRAFELDDAAKDLIARLHAEIPAFREPQASISAKTLFAFLVNALPSVPNLCALSPELQGLAVNSKRYEPTAANLRAAASLEADEPISADNLIDKEIVWEYCVERIDDYLTLVEGDEHIASSCTAPGVLVSVVNAQHEDWSPDQMEAFLEASAESAALPDITAIEQSAWITVVEALRMIPNIVNLQAYVTINDVDDALGEVITDDADGVVEIDGLETATEEQLGILIPRLLNADDALIPRQRVLLAKQLLAAPESPGLDLSAIEARPDALLAELLREGVVQDSEEVFTHFLSAGWPAIEPALLVSTNASTFLAPSFCAGHTTDLIRNSRIPDSTRREVLERLTEFAPAKDSKFLVAAASVARTLGVLLSTEALLLIAPAVGNYEDVVWQLHEHDAAVDPNIALRILGRMSGDFARFAGPSGSKFEVPDTPSLENVLKRLKVAGLLASQPGRQPSGRWKLRIV